MKIKKKITLFVMVFVLISSVLPTLPLTSSLPFEFRQIQDGKKGQRLVAYQPDTMTISEFEWSYFLHGIIYPKSDQKEYKHIKFHLYIDGVEIHLQKAKEQEINEYGEKIIKQWFYHTFDEYYFAPGIYDWHVIAEDKGEIIWDIAHPLTVHENGKQLIVYDTSTMIIAEGQRSFVKHGWIDLPEADFESLKPFNVKVEIDGSAIDLFYVEEKIETETETYYNLWFYQTFEAHYFTPGVYIWNVTWSDNTGIIANFCCPLSVISDGQQLNVFYPETMAITTTQPCFIEHGFMTTNPADIFLYPGFEVLLFIDDIEIELESQQRIEGGTNYYWTYYKHFESGYFSTGLYDVKVIWKDNTGILLERSHFLTVLNDYHRLNFFDPESMTLGDYERGYVKHGYSFTGIEEVMDAVPFNTQLFINYAEVSLDLLLEIDYSGELAVYTYYFYKNFDQNYFDPGVLWCEMVWTDAIGIYFEKAFPLTIVEDGMRIMSLEDYGDYYISEGQMLWVRQGWGGSYEQMYAHDADWEFFYKLYINYEEIPLCQTFEYPYVAFDMEYIWWNYVHFDPYYFEPGYYEIKGWWHNSTHDLTMTRGLFVYPDGHQINPIYDPSSLTFSTFDRTFFRYSMVFPEDQLELIIPTTIMLYLDGDFVHLEQSLHIMYLGTEIYYGWRFYCRFEQDYFDPGAYGMIVHIETGLGVYFIEHYIIVVDF